MKHLEIETYTKHEIKVMVKIDYDNKTISLVEKREQSGEFFPKSWVFGKREVGYMPGWLQILDAMKFAIVQAQTKLQAHLDLQTKEKEDIIEFVFKEDAKRTPRKK